MAAGGFSFVARVRVQLEPSGVEVQLRVLFEQRFINATELRTADVFVVHRAAEAALLREGERANGLEEMAVGKLTTIECRRCAFRPEETAERRKTEARATVL